MDIEQQEASDVSIWKKEPESYGFDITKADKIFDLLLSEGLIKLKPYHKILSEEELKNMKYCKWHNAMSHDKSMQSLPAANSIGFRARETEV